MEISQIQSILKNLMDSSSDIELAMIVTLDGLALAYEGRVDDQDQVAALTIELQLVCNKILHELNCGSVEDIFVRSRFGGVVILPIPDKGILACLIKPEAHTGKLQIQTWKAVKSLAAVL